MGFWTLALTPDDHYYAVLRVSDRVLEVQNDPRLPLQCRGQGGLQQQGA